jgi:hypothetical protein
VKDVAASSDAHRGGGSTKKKTNKKNKNKRNHASLLAFDIGSGNGVGVGFTLGYPWSFNGMAVELAGTVHGPMRSWQDAEVELKLRLRLNF